MCPQGVLPPVAVKQACAAISGVLSEAGWLAEGVDPSERQARPDFREHELRMNGYRCDFQKKFDDGGKSGPG